MMPFVDTLAFAFTFLVKFEEKLEALKYMVPFEGFMVTKLIESRNPKFKSFSNEKDKVGLEVPARHICVAVKRKLT